LCVAAQGRLDSFLSSQFEEKGGVNPLAIASVATRLVATVLVVVMLARLYRSRVGIWAIVLLSITFSPVLFSVAFQLFAKVTRRPEVDWRPDGLLGRDVWQLWISVAVLLSIVVLDRILARFMRTEERLRDSEDRLRSMITAVPDTILIFDVVEPFDSRTCQSKEQANRGSSVAPFFNWSTRHITPRFARRFLRSSRRKNRCELNSGHREMMVRSAGFP